ncbi:hypothetical protein [Seramator thermalis]|uniref:hypothetical protein n=1 Tax=Seramator thermalis TaxID=2496270 RepID=UPI00101C1876|nr:hypothetical protein [Seramator thermalis]
MNRKKVWPSSSGKLPRYLWMKYGGCFSSIIRKLQEVPFIEHFIETMSIGFRRQEREKAEKFKEYEPGCLHVDVTYLPAFA